MHLTEQIQIERWTPEHSRWPALLAACDEMGPGGLDEKTCEFHLGRFWMQQIGVDEDKPPYEIE